MFKTIFTLAAGSWMMCVCAASGIAVKALPVQDCEIRLDGVLDEAVWKQAEKHGNFTVFRHPEKPATEQTAFRAAA